MEEERSEGRHSDIFSHWLSGMFSKLKMDSLLMKNCRIALSYNHLLMLGSEERNLCVRSVLKRL